MPDLPIMNPISLILGITSVISTLLYLREYNKRDKLQKEGEKILEDFRVKGLETLHQSIQKSENIISEAELAGVKVMADAKIGTSKLEEDYSKKLSELLLNSRQIVSSAQTEAVKFINDLQMKSAHFEETSIKTAEGRINEMFERLESRLAGFLVTTEQKTTYSIELELKASRNLIENYKEQQLKLIDENIITMMEQTLNLVLAKKLSLKDQLDLVYEALERAKIEKFVI